MSFVFLLPANDMKFIICLKCFEQRIKRPLCFEVKKASMNNTRTNIINGLSIRPNELHVCCNPIRLLFLLGKLNPYETSNKRLSWRGKKKPHSKWTLTERE